MDFIQEAIKEAFNAMGKSTPNPPVGAIIVSKDNRIIGRGHTQSYGRNHAEIEAINNSNENLGGSTLYTTLEPCNILNNTPPCTDTIIKSKIKHVVIGAIDVNSDINGRGIKQLNENGITTELIKDNDKIEYTLESYNHFVIHKTPFVTLKLALSIDGKLATNSGDSKWISSEQSRNLVHKYRSDADVIITSVNTVIADNPRLNVRLENYTKNYQPRKIILDTNGRIPVDSQCLDSNTIVITSKMNKKVSDVLISKSVIIEKIPLNESGKLDLNYLPRILLKNNMINVLVECGSALSSELLKLNLLNKLLLFVSPKIIGGSKFIPFSNINSDKMNNVIYPKKVRNSQLDEDMLVKVWF
jgi:diaminohydroxyphosphoribosylaminopyrimidine deaminase/5-amino-6-(5-phosphoribosylamino)uracil reductase